MLRDILKKFLTVIVIISAVSVICYCGYQILTTLQERALSKKEYINVRESYVSSIDGKGDEEENKLSSSKSGYIAKSDPGLKVDHEGLSKINSDYIGWIYYKDGDISYPMTKASTNNINYYLDHSFEGQNLASGCIFIDSNAEEDFSMTNTFIYGHNMANGTMFGAVKKIYEDPSVYADPYIYIYLKDGTEKIYRVYAIYVTNENDKKTYMIPQTEEVLKSYINRGLTLGTAYANIGFTDEETEILQSGTAPVISLSTCFGRAGTDKRLLVHGVLVETK